MINFTKLYLISVGKRFPNTMMALVFAAFAATFAPATAQANSDAEAMNKRPKIVVFGDSLSAGYQLPLDDGFPNKLQAVLDAKGLQVDVIGAGVSGDTTSGGLARLNWSVPQDVDGVLLELGANDSLRGIPPQNTKDNLEAMITQLQERGVKVLLIGMLAPPNMGEEYAKEYNAIFPQLAQKYDLPLYPFFLDGVLTKPELMLGDGIHPNARGVDVMVGGILPMVETLIEELRPTP